MAYLSIPTACNTPKAIITGRICVFRLLVWKSSVVVLPFIFQDSVTQWCPTCPKPQSKVRRVGNVLVMWGHSRSTHYWTTASVKLWTQHMHKSCHFTSYTVTSVYMPDSHYSFLLYVHTFHYIAPLLGFHLSLYHQHHLIETLLLVSWCFCRILHILSLISLYYPVTPSGN